MKRCMVLMLAMFLLVGTIGCKSPEVPFFEENKQHLLEIKDFVLSHYGTESTQLENEDYVAMWVWDVGADGLAISDEMTEAIEAVGAEFSCLWVAEDYVIFWEDETKHYGLLWAESGKQVIKSLREWYTPMECRKIESGWYEIGVLNSI